MPIDAERSSVQSDPRNTAKSDAPRIRMSFVVVVLVFIALAVTAMLIWLRA